MKVGIITWHYYPNFGSSLQAHALQEIVSYMGHSIRIVNYRNPKISHTSAYKDLIRFVLSITIGRYIKRFRYPHINYMGNYLKQTKRLYTEDELRTYANKFDAILCGSDQIWAPNVYNPIYFASFFDGKKVSYAASIGISEIPKKLIPEYCKHLNRFSHIGVREEEGQILLKNTCGINSDIVLDPTLILPIEHYKQMERPIYDVQHPYIFCYFLNEDHQYKKCVEDYAFRNQLSIVGCSANNQDSGWMKILSNISACEFLWLIHHAQIVLTDSYHGTIFSLLYHKDFRTFIRFSENDPISQNSRIRQLNTYFDIEHQIQDAHQTISSFEYDYVVFEDKLRTLRNKSVLFLKNALEC